MEAFPLQHKKLQRLTLPYLRVGTCEMMNTAKHYMMDSFHAFNTKNSMAFSDVCPQTAQSSSAAASPSVDPLPSFMGQMVAGGLVDSYTGGAVSRFVAAYLSRALSLHTVVPEEIRNLRKEFPDDPLVQLMLAAAHQQRIIRPAAGGAAPAPYRRVVSGSDLQQYAVSADAAFFKACSILKTVEDQAGHPTSARQQERRLQPHEKRFADMLVKEMNAFELPANEGAGANVQSAATDVERVMESGCRAAWFTATVAPTIQEVLLREGLARRGESRPAGAAPPPRRTLQSQDELLRTEIANARRLLAEQSFYLDVTVGNVGDARAFGIARNALTEGSKSVLDPTRERIVPLSVDHKPFRHEEYHRIVRAGGVLDSAAGEVIDGNPFYSVSRSFGHWQMKRNAKLSPVQQKLIAVPHTASWRMLSGDVLVLANHAVFETRGSDDSNMDEVAKVVGRAADDGLPPEEIAAAVCDFAIRFGSSHSLQVMVAVADKPLPDATTAATGVAAQPPTARYDEWVAPGPLYVEACRSIPYVRDAFLRDCARCGVTPAEMLERRWQRVRDVLPTRHRLPLMSLYGKECGVLQQIMDEEAELFNQDALQGAAAQHGEGSGAGRVSSDAVKAVFVRLAKSLLGGQGRKA